MLSRYLMHGMIVLLATLALVSGCSRKIVRPNQVPQGRLLLLERDRFQNRNSREFRPN